ncbi:MAG TPA: DUF3231 family protein [Symbiobacteriaceae bacterium]|nr:DUF3231 family protein [Symbiobacteriaceae bacterium]
MNILQSLFHEVTKVDDPLHVGEVMNLWLCYTGVAESRSICLLLTNHTNDSDLKEIIEHLIDDLETPMIKRLGDLMLSEGVALPAITGDKPKADESAIPLGAKLTDAEIANLLVVKLEGMLTVCHTGLIQSIRPDLGRMFYAFQSHLLAQGLSLKNLMQLRGWIRLPPYFRPSSPHSEA